MGITTFVLWMVNFSIGLFFPIVVESFGISTTFFGFAFLGVFALLFAWLYVPETKGKTLEQLQEEFLSEDWKNLKKEGSSSIYLQGCTPHSPITDLNSSVADKFNYGSVS